LHAAHQFIEGDVYHWWFSIRGGGPRTNCSDDLLWLPFILDAYLKETADFAILDEIAPYLNGPAEPLYDHCKRAIERSFSRFSPRGVPLIGDHDWNDGLSAVGTLMKGESFWVGEFLYMILGNFIPLAQARGDSAFAEKCAVVRESLKDALNRHGWDGAWYLQATTDGGMLLGSEINEEGKNFPHAQQLGGDQWDCARGSRKSSHGLGDEIPVEGFWHPAELSRLHQAAVRHRLHHAVRPRPARKRRRVYARGHLVSVGLCAGGAGRASL